MNNKHIYTANMESHNFILGTVPIFIHPSATKFEEEAYYLGIRIFIHLAANIKSLMNDLEHFCLALKKFFLTLIHFIPWRNYLTIIDNHAWCVCFLGLDNFLVICLHHS